MTLFNNYICVNGVINIIYILCGLSDLLAAIQWTYYAIAATTISYSEDLLSLSTKTYVTATVYDMKDDKTHYVIYIYIYIYIIIHVWVWNAYTKNHVYIIFYHRPEALEFMQCAVIITYNVKEFIITIQFTHIVT